MQIFAFGTFTPRVNCQCVTQNLHRFTKPSQLFVSQTEVIQRVEVILGDGKHLFVVFGGGLIVVQFFSDVAGVVQRVHVLWL